MYKISTEKKLNNKISKASRSGLSSSSTISKQSVSFSSLSQRTDRTISISSSSSENQSCSDTECTKTKDVSTVDVEQQRFDQRIKDLIEASKGLADIGRVVSGGPEGQEQTTKFLLKFNEVMPKARNLIETDTKCPYGYILRAVIAQLGFTFSNSISSFLKVKSEKYSFARTNQVLADRTLKYWDDACSAVARRVGSDGGTIKLDCFENGSDTQCPWKNLKPWSCNPWLHKAFSRLSSNPQFWEEFDQFIAREGRYAEMPYLEPSSEVIKLLKASIVDLESSFAVRNLPPNRSILHNLRHYGSRLLEVEYGSSEMSKRIITYIVLSKN